MHLIEYEIHQGMKTKRLLIGFLSLISILSCEKDNDIKQIEGNVENARLKRILLYSSADSEEPICIVDEYEYDSLNRVSKVSSPWYKEGEIVGTIKYDSYMYNSIGQLERISNYNANLNSPNGFINLKNYIYTYSDNGLKIKELIEYPQISSFEYTLFSYSGNQLIKTEKYNDADELEAYTKYEYNDIGELIKEISYSANDIEFSVVINTYVNGLNTLTEMYTGNQENKIREIYKTYDSNGNLIMIESNELMPYSSLLSHVLRYEYYED